MGAWHREYGTGTMAWAPQHREYTAGSMAEAQWHGECITGMGTTVWKPWHGYGNHGTGTTTQVTWHRHHSIGATAWRPWHRHGDHSTGTMVLGLWQGDMAQGPRQGNQNTECIVGTMAQAWGPRYRNYNTRTMSQAPHCKNRGMSMGTMEQGPDERTMAQGPWCGHRTGVSGLSPLHSSWEQLKVPWTQILQTEVMGSAPTCQPPACGDPRPQHSPSGAAMLQAGARWQLQCQGEVVRCGQGGGQVAAAQCGGDTGPVLQHLRTSAGTGRGDPPWLDPKPRDPHLGGSGGEMGSPRWWGFPSIGVVPGVEEVPWGEVRSLGWRRVPRVAGLPQHGVGSLW